MAYQLILSSDTLDIGRQKMNSFMQSSAGIWSSDTPNYSVVSLQGSSNNNMGSGSYSFITGKNNSGITGNFHVIPGGYKNKVNGPFCSVLGGTLNSQTNTLAKYNSILNGKSNSIAEDDIGIYDLRRSYNSILNGKSTSVNGRLNVALASESGTIAGNSNMIQGVSNQILKNTASSPSTSKGPQFNVQFGLSNYLRGGDLSYFNLMVGYLNRIGNASTGYLSQHNTLKGKSNTVYGSFNLINGIGNKSLYGEDYNFFHGRFITNDDNAGGANSYKSNAIIFGKGTSLASPLRPSTASNDYQFVLGSQAFRRFRFRFDGTPTAYGTGAWNGGAADYGEYFEWHDGNQNEENRAGYFVEILEGKVKVAQSENVIGVVSKTPGFVGDSIQDHWAEIYLKDEWGVVIQQKIDKYYFLENENKKEVYFDSDGMCYSEIPNSRNKDTVKLDLLKEQCVFQKTMDVPIQNPDYDPSQLYIPRNKRKEWEVIGLLGKLRVRTKEQITGNAVDVDTSTGMAKNGTKYPILKKNKDFDGNYGIVTIFFK